MRALVFDGQLRLVDDYAFPIPPLGEQLVRVRRAGICNTDLEIIKGYQGFHGVLGHEFVGELEDGRRVVGEINAYDGTCPACRRGDVTHCELRSVLGIAARDGALAEYLVLPTSNLHQVPESVTDRQAVFVEPLAAALEIADRLHVKPTARVAVIGDGKLGLLCAQVLFLSACDLTVVGRHARKLAILKRRGITTTSEPAQFARDFDIVVECSGQPGGLEIALKLLRPRGALVCKSTFHGTQELALAPLVVDEISLLGSRCGPFAPALRMLARGLVDVDSLVDAEYPLARAMKAFQHAATPGTLKIQVIMGSQ